jgi:hypothetical protein
LFGSQHKAEQAKGINAVTVTSPGQAKEQLFFPVAINKPVPGLCHFFLAGIPFE